MYGFLRGGAYLTHEQLISSEMDPKTANFNKNKPVFYIRHKKWKTLIYLEKIFSLHHIILSEI